MSGALSGLARRFGVGEVDGRRRTLDTVQRTLVEHGYPTVTVRSYRYGQVVLAAGPVDAQKLAYDLDRIVAAVKSAGGDVDTITVSVAG